MLTLKQSPLAILGLLVAFSLAEGGQEPGRLATALLMVVLTVVYIVSMSYLNFKHANKNGKEK